ncbi:MAG: (Fe-S)-binding protein [Actinomycetota bacterium]|nr:(Fe-S)-binding protein [Actinomycetota bacterium]
MRIALFVTCVNDAVFPATGRAVVTVLERLGHEVAFPAAQTCCGQMHLNSGYRREAAALARRVVRELDGYEAVVVPSASCAGTVVESYAQLASDVGDGPLEEAARSLAPRVHELTQLLVDVLGVTDVGASFPHRVAYHPTCHSLRSLALGERPVELLRNVRGLSLVPLEDSTTCCGFGGTFALKNPDVSVAMVADKVARLTESGAEVCCAADNSCLTHIGGAATRLRSRFRVMHLAEVLASTEGTPGGLR